MKLTSLWPFRHAALKAVSVALAVVLWMAVSGDEVVERGLRVPLELQQFPPGLELSGEPPTAVDVRVRGASSALSRLSPGEIVAVLDLRAARAGRRLFQLTPENARAPFGVQVVQVTPSSTALVFENSADRSVRVIAEISGDPAPGFVIGTVTVEPEMVEVTGPESAIGRATEALTEAVSVSGAREDISESVSVGLLDPLLRLKNPRPAMVRVQVRPGPRERSLAGVPVHLRNLGAGHQAQAIPAAVGVVLRGTREAVDRVSPSEVTAWVDLANLGSGEYALRVEVDPPKDAGVTQVMPADVQVRISSLKE